MPRTFDVRSLGGPMAVATIALLIVAALLGGASRQHELRLAAVELAALPALVLAITLGLQRTVWRTHRLALGILAGCLAIPVVQLLPLPPAIWTSLAGRAELSLALELAGAPEGWLPLSLTPDKTWRSLLALLPPTAMFLGVLLSPRELRPVLVKILLALTVAGIGLGAAQLASGGEGLYPWRTTSAGDVVGFFANRNHLATLCLIAIPFLMVIGAAELRRGRTQSGTMWFSAMAVGLVIVALGAIRSRTGLALALPALGASAIAAWIAAGRGRPAIFLWAGVGAAAIAATVVGVFALGPILDRFDNTAAVGRMEKWPIVAEAADAYLPFGSGLGSFDAVFRSVEPLDQLDATFFNQAHNEYLETWLETGWLGMGLLVVFLVWFARRTLTVWRSKPSTETDLRRASSIAIAMVLAHSIVDYPLRTVAIAVVFALCCAILEAGSARSAEARTAD